MEMMDNRYTYMRHPILLRFYSFVGFPVRQTRGTARPDESLRKWRIINVRVSVIPVYVWWNPYNVDMKRQGAEGGPWVAYFKESTATCP